MVVEKVMELVHHPKASFEWRITRFEDGDRYTLMGWSNVKEKDQLPPEYTNFPGQVFWIDDGDFIHLSGVLFTRSDKVYVKRGDVMEKDDYDKVIAHLTSASENLRRVNETISNASECITIKV